MKRILGLGLGSLALALVLTSCGGGTSDALANKTASQVLSTAIAAAKSSGSAHYLLKATSSGKTETIVGDAATKVGRQVFSDGTAKIQAEAIGTTVYVEGNEGGLQNQIGFSATEAAQYAGKWISIATTDGPYASVLKAVTLASTLTEIKPTGKLTLTKATTRSGIAVIGVRGPLPGAAKGVTGSVILYVATQKPNVPVSFEAQATGAGTSERDVGTFSRWGTPLHLVAPKNAVAYASLVPSTGTPSG
jgi:hypothetical protein